MQIKKNTRDAHYPEAAQYEQNGYASDSTDQFGDAPEGARRTVPDHRAGDGGNRHVMRITARGDQRVA